MQFGEREREREREGGQGNGRVGLGGVRRVQGLLMKQKLKLFYLSCTFGLPKVKSFVLFIFPNSWTLYWNSLESWTICKRTLKIEHLNVDVGHLPSTYLPMYKFKWFLLELLDMYVMGVGVFLYWLLFSPTITKTKTVYNSPDRRDEFVIWTRSLWCTKNYKVFINQVEFPGLFLKLTSHSQLYFCLNEKLLYLWI